MARYQHLFFDLDHTLWDFERNSIECLHTIFQDFSLQNLGITHVKDFVEKFIEINTELWNDFDQGRIAHSYIREHRFRLVFEALGMYDVPKNQEMAEEYLNLLPQKSHLLDGAVEILGYCQAKGYRMHIITNGFDHIQTRKMESSGINHYFDNMITNERAGAKKPDHQIFKYATTIANANQYDSLMIGDNWEADIMGALRFGMDAAFYNPASRPCYTPPTYNILHLKELMNIL